MPGTAITRRCLRMVKQDPESLGPLSVTARIEVRGFSKRVSFLTPLNLGEKMMQIWSFQDLFPIHFLFRDCSHIL